MSIRTKKKILSIITTEFGTNGITVVAMNLFRNMDKSRIQMDFISKNPVPAYLEEEIRQAGGRIYVLPDRKKNLYLYLMKMKRIMKDGYDVVHVHGNSTTMSFELYMAKRHKIPVRLAHGHSSSCDFQRLNKILKPFFYKLYTHGITCSETAGNWLFGEHPFMIFHNAIDLDAYTFDDIKNDIRNDIREKLGVENKIVLIHAGTFNKVKNQEFLIKCFKTIKEKDGATPYHLLLAGEGEGKEAAMRQVEQYGLAGEITFLGNRKDIPSLLQAADIMLLPSLYEGLGIILMEAQAAGLPCIVSKGVPREANICGEMIFSDIMDGGTAFIHALYKVVQSIHLENRTDKREKYSKDNCVKLSEKGYDIRKEVDKVQKIYLTGSKEEY